MGRSKRGREGESCENGRILTKRLMQVTEKKVSDEQGGFRKGKSCMDQIFVNKKLVEEYLGQDREVVCSLYGLRESI